MPEFKSKNKFYDIPDHLVDEFKISHPDAEEIISEEPGKINPANQIGAKNAGQIEAPNMDLFSETSFSDSQEKDTALERTFGKNSLTDFFGDIYRSAQKGLQQAELVDPSIDLLRSEGNNDEIISKYIAANKESLEKAVQSDEMRSFNKIYEEEGGGWWGFIKGAANNPSVLTQELVSSIAMQIGALQSDEVAGAATTGLVAGAAAGAPLFGVGAVAGGVAGAMSGAMVGLETGLTFSELLNEEIGENLTVENVKAILQNEEKLSELKNKALGRGLTIGAIELATMGLAKGVGSTVAKAGFRGAVPAGLAAGGAIEIAGGGLGEVAGRFVAGQEMDVAEIGFEAFAGLGSAPITLGKQITNTGKNIDKIKINKILKETEYTDIVDLFLNEEKTSQKQLDISNFKNSFDIFKEKLNEKVKSGKITKEEANKAGVNFTQTQDATSTANIMEFDEANKLSLIDLLKERDNLRNYIKKVNDKALTEAEQNKVKELESEIKNLASISAGKKLKQSVSFAKKAGKALGLKTEILNSEQIKEKYGNDPEFKDLKIADGFIRNGLIVINTDVAKERGAVTVGSHEILHGILNTALKGKDREKIVNRFKKIIGKEQLAVVEGRLKAVDPDTKKRLYEDKYLAKEGIDEYFTAFSDAIIKKEIQYNENIFTKLGDLIRPILRKYGFAKIKFETGRDVYNFLKEYNKSVKEGQLSQEIIDLGAETSQTQLSVSKKASDKVQDIYEKQGAGGAIDIIDQFEPIVNKLVNKYRNVPGFEYELLKDEIETGKRGILDMIMDYTPEKAKGAPLAGYINTFLNRRAIEAANRVLKTDFELDVTEAKGVTDTATAEEIIEREEVDPVNEIKSLRKEIQLSEELVTIVKDAIIKTFGTKLPNPQDPKFRLELQKRFRTELKKPMAKFVGKQADYESFLRDNFRAIYDKLPQSLINKRFKEFAEPVLDKNGKQLRERTAEGNKIFTKKKITLAEFIKYFLGSDVGRSTQGTRKTAIVEAVAEEIAFDATMEVLQSPDVINKYQDIAGITGEVLPENFKSLIAKQVNRAEDFKFSKSLANVAKEEYNLESQELAKILDKTSLDKLSNKYPLISNAIIYEADPADIKFSLTTKADGKWIQEPLGPPAESSKLYKFKIGEIDYEIKTFKDPDAFNYDIFEQTENIEDGAIDNDPKSWAMSFADADTGSTDITGVAAEGLTNQFKVFGTVANATIDLIKKEKLNSITFTAKEGSRKRLYNSLNKKFANELKWETYDYQADLADDSETIFIAYDPKAFPAEEQITTPTLTKFSKGKNSEYNISAKELLYDKKSFNKFRKLFLMQGSTFQDEVGDYKTRSGSMPPSHVLDPTRFKGYKSELSNKERQDFDKKIDNLRIELKNIETKNKTSVLNKNESYLAPAKFIGKTLNQILNNLKTGEIFRRTKAYQRIYKTMWEKYYNILNKNPEMYDFLEMTLDTSNSKLDHWHRLGALFLGFDQGALPVQRLDKKGNPMFIRNRNGGFILDSNGNKIPEIRTFEYEHAVQNDLQWNKLLKAAAEFAKKNDKKGFIDFVEKSMEDYVLVGLSFNDARKVDKAGFARLMPEGWKRWWDRYFNNKVAKIDGGINPNNISFIEYTDTKAGVKGNIGQQFNINDSEGNTQLSRTLSRQYNEDILQATTGVKWFEKFSPVEARIKGKGKGKKFFIPYSADDFVGLLYTTLGKGEVGNKQMEWYQNNLLRPFSRGIQQYEAAKQNALREWQIIKKEAKKDVPGGLNKKNATGLTNQDAVRIFIWNEQGMEIPGAGNKLINDNLEVVKNNPKLQEFAERLMALNPEGYPEPSKNWDSGDITTDIVSYINDVKRSEFLTEFKENAEEIFSDENKQKLRALYGDNYIEALDDILFRMTTGTNRRKGASKVEQQFMNWTNNSVGAIMFFNARSAVLQTLSAVNFINFSDNNPINAAIAFANFPQYIKDFVALFNSDFLKQRRTGLQTDVNADEIARAAKGSKNTARAILSALLKFGFTPTQIADSFAIASGGATFYRNRIKTYLKEGLTQKEAEEKAFTDFQEIAEETQQSARPDRISLQQASSLGRIVLAFANTPMQYARLTKKATLDLINGRGDWKTNVSKIAYYSVIQNIIFSALQQGLFALLFDDEDDDKEKSRLFRIGNSSIDTLLRGIGVYGAAAATVKNMILEIIEQSEKSRPDYTKLAIEATSISPPINSKLRKLESAGKTFTYKQSKEKVFTEGFSLENPAFLAGGKVLSAATNLPADRVVQKADHIYTAMQHETELWQAIALSLGWSKWDLGMIKNQTKKSKTPLRKGRKSLTRKSLTRKTIK
jgi:hypothetical protein